ncbi:MAG: hypothetical protein JWO80_2960 [Bryobacterales bacterium]|nr:hypothetical protein [Bryobacterales bacterium]
MFQRTHNSIAIGIVMLAPAVLAAATDPEITDLHPFTRVAYIPVGADLSSIEFERIETVKVATKRKFITSMCEAGYQEPGGSMYCPYIQDESLAPAYQISYSFSAPPMASDEYGNTRFTFSVYLHLEDLEPAVRRTVSVGGIGREDAAAYFRLTTFPVFVQRTATDEAASTRCDGNYVDGTWTQTNPDCEDQFTLTTVTIPSNYVMVRVDPTSPSRQKTGPDHGPALAGSSPVPQPRLRPASAPSGEPSDCLRTTSSCCPPKRGRNSAWR